MEEKVTVIYIISDRRSGSTLLENILSKSPDAMSLGELAMLNGHIKKEGPGELWNWNCSCGKQIMDCEFWSKVLAGVYDDGFETKIAWSYKSLEILLLAGLPFSSKKPLLNFIHTGNNLATIAKLNAIYTSVAAVSNKKIIVDSSKDPLQALAVNECANVDAKFIWLLRDLRAVTHSKMKHWQINKRSNKKLFEALTDSYYYKRICSACLKNIDKKNVIKLSYESLIESPQQHLDAICNAFGLKSFVVPTHMELLNNHTIAGTPGRFEKKAIYKDDSWKKFYDDHFVLNALGKVFNVL